MALAAIRNRHETSPPPRHLKLAVDIFQTDEEELIAKAERQMFQEGRIEICLQPRHMALNLPLNVTAGHLPTVGELFGNLVHLNVVHDSSAPYPHA